jgi:hypothetical protein
MYTLSSVEVTPSITLPFVRERRLLNVGLRRIDWTLGCDRIDGPCEPLL